MWTHLGFLFMASTATTQPTDAGVCHAGVSHDHTAAAQLRDRLAVESNP